MVTGALICQKLKETRLTVTAGTRHVGRPALLIHAVREATMRPLLVALVKLYKTAIS